MGSLCGSRATPDQLKAIRRCPLRRRLPPGPGQRGPQRAARSTLEMADDLRPNLGVPRGASPVHDHPGHGPAGRPLARLPAGVHAATGLLAVRSSYMSDRRPDRIRVWNDDVSASRRPIRPPHRLSPWSRRFAFAAVPLCFRDPPPPHTHVPHRLDPGRGAVFSLLSPYMSTVRAARPVRPPASPCRLNPVAMAPCFIPLMSLIATLTPLPLQHACPRPAVPDWDAQLDAQAQGMPTYCGLV